MKSHPHHRYYHISDIKPFDNYPKPLKLVDAAFKISMATNY
jgi:hypothetical protein